MDANMSSEWTEESLVAERVAQLEYALSLTHRPSQFPANGYTAQSYYGELRFFARCTL